MSDAAEELLADLPELHYWGGEAQVGGLTTDVGHLLISELSQLQSLKPLSVIETGAGATTLLILCLQPTKLISIAPDPELRDRILHEATARGIESGPLEYISERSETALPRLARSGQGINVALIDGGHGWPTVFVDFCYLNQMLDRDSLLLLDDLQLWSVAQLFRLLQGQCDFELAARIRNFAVFRKTSDELFLPDWEGQPFIVANSVRRMWPRLVRHRVGKTRPIRWLDNWATVVR
jgi:hypothetical protein